MDDKTRDLASLDDMLGDFQPGALAIGPGGGISAALPDDRPLPDFESDSLCVGCRHYWRIVSAMDTAAPETYAELGVEDPVQIARSCVAHPGTETQLSGDVPIYECNRFTPKSRLRRVVRFFTKG